MVGGGRPSREAWIRTSLELTLCSIGELVELGRRGAVRQVAPVIRDLAEHVAIWAEELSGGDDGAPAPLSMATHPPAPHSELADSGGTADLETAAYIARVASGLRARFDGAGAPGAPLPPGLRRTAAACAADLDTHLARAEATVRNGERHGSGAILERIRAGLPSRSEFLRAG